MSHLNISASSRTGCVRTNNEDMILVGEELLRNGLSHADFETTDSNRCMLAIADGMGGHNCGEVASYDALTNMSFYFKDLPSNLDEKDFVDAMTNWLKSICLAVDAKGKENPMYKGMGTTFVALTYYSGRYYWLNCGDSRLYRLRDGELRQLTTDHSLSNALGLMTHSSQIVNCIGGGTTEAYIDIENITDDVKKGDVYMLCSDGLTDMITDSEVKEILNRSLEADTLCEAADNAGGYDNVSVIVLKIE